MLNFLCGISQIQGMEENLSGPIYWCIRSAVHLWQRKLGTLPVTYMLFFVDVTVHFSQPCLVYDI
jgi:hypothetical protein